MIKELKKINKFQSIYKFNINNNSILSPFFIPSFSSIKDPYFYDRFVNYSKDIFQNIVLISAYDFHKILFENKEIIKIINNVNILLDSGGYENLIYKDKEYTINDYQKVINETNPAIVSSYDMDLSLRPRESIAVNSDFLDKNRNRMIDFIFHRNGNFYEFLLDLQSGLEEHSDRIDIVGLVDSELGSNIIQKAKQVKKVKKMMSKYGFSQPIHIFGCSDLLAIDSYVKNGANIFDGLNWFDYTYDGNILRGLPFDCLPLLECECSFCKNQQWESIEEDEYEKVVCFHNLLQINEKMNDLREGF